MKVTTTKTHQVSWPELCFLLVSRKAKEEAEPLMQKLGFIVAENREKFGISNDKVRVVTNGYNEFQYVECGDTKLKIMDLRQMIITDRIIFTSSSTVETEVKRFT